MVEIKEGDYLISNLYQGGYSSLDPSYGSLFTGYRSTVSEIGLATDPRTANVLKEVSDKIAPGQKTMELSFIQPEVLESVPKPHLKEIKRLAKLTGVDITMHAPLVEASGLAEREGFTEANREIAERQMISAVEKAHEVSPSGNTPVTFHSAALLPSRVKRKLPEEELRKMSEEEKKMRGIVDGVEIERMLIIDQETGQIVPAKKEEKFYPYKFHGQKKVEITKHDVKSQVETMNNTQWHDSLSNLVAPKERADRIIHEEYLMAQPVVNMEEADDKEGLKRLRPEQMQSYSRYQNAQLELTDVQTHLNALFNRAYKYGSDKDKKELDKMAEVFTKQMHKVDPIDRMIRRNRDVKVQSAAIQGLIQGLNDLTQTPQLFKPIDDFAFDKSAKTFGNVAFESYKKYGKEAPIVSIENPPTSIAGFSTGEELKNLVKESRKKFVDRAVKDGMDKSKAKEEAEKMIGVTWDVGHINQLRRFGYTKEDVIKETEKIAPFLKHIHLSDNFGIENVELPMGMGNVPYKEMMEKLGKRADNVKQIVEAGNWWQHFKISPMGETFNALGSPIYSMEQAPYWNQAVGFQQGYFGGYGQMLPAINYETFGAGFSGLPQELGGQKQGGQGSRMSGRPME